MTGAVPVMEHKAVRRKTVIWLLVAAGLAVFVGANAHLVYVAASSQPDCIPHARAGDATAGGAQFSAARSSCSSR